MYRYLIVVLNVMLLLGSCHSNKKLVSDKKSTQTDIPNSTGEATMVPDTAGKLAKIVFDSTVYHFGTIKEGEKFATQIQFTNQGPGDLVIELVSACECTTLDWPRLPVKAGRRGTIKIDYNSKGKEGPQSVDVDVIANTDPIVTYATFKLNVIK